MIQTRPSTICHLLVALVFSPTLAPLAAQGSTSTLSAKRFWATEPSVTELRETPLPGLPPATDLSHGGPSGVTLVDTHVLSRLATGNSVAPTAEPSVASRGDEVLVTGNHFASFSTDRGKTFRYRSPYQAFTGPETAEFCCDQVALFVPGSTAQEDLMVWLLQYGDGSGGSGSALRLAVAKGSDIPGEKWHYYDLTPSDLGLWSNVYFDYNDLAASAGHLYISTWATPYFDGTAGTQRAVMMRVPLPDLEQLGWLEVKYVIGDGASAFKPVRGANDTMYWAAHRPDLRLRVYSWEDSSDEAHFFDVTVDEWRDGPYVAPTPDGGDWLTTVDGSITAGWMTKPTAGSVSLGFAWTASAHPGQMPYPHVRVAIVDPQNPQQRPEQPHLWSPDTAYAYPAAAVLKSGEVGVTIAYGGGGHYPSHAVGKLNAGSTPRWLLAPAGRGGEASPADGTWGDYLAIQSHPTGRGWLAAGFRLGSSKEGAPVRVQLVHFE